MVKGLRLRDVSRHGRFVSWKFRFSSVLSQFRTVLDELAINFPPAPHDLGVCGFGLFWWVVSGVSLITAGYLRIPQDTAGSLQMDALMESSILLHSIVIL